MNFIKMALATLSLAALTMASSGWRSGKLLQVQTIRGTTAPIGQIVLADKTVYCFPLNDAGALQMYSTFEKAIEANFTVQVLVQHPNNNTNLYTTLVYYPVADGASRQEQRRAFGVSMDR